MLTGISGQCQAPRIHYLFPEAVESSPKSNNMQSSTWGEFWSIGTCRFLSLPKQVSQGDRVFRVTRARV